tara:strand:+ start:2778 stop:3026 length:249 start_codon:yes stop_codon:yes gene_type:complete
MWTLYILKCYDLTLYTGITVDLKKRIKTHLKGKGAKYIRGRTPIELVYTECFDTRSAATKREILIKKLSKINKMKLIEDQKI